MTAIFAEVFGMIGQRRKRKGNECGVIFAVCFDLEVVACFKLYYKSIFESSEKRVKCILIYLIFCRMVTSVFICPKLSINEENGYVVNQGNGPVENHELNHVGNQEEGLT
jgi:hypothetical protein